MEIQFFDAKLKEFIATLEKTTIAKVVHSIELLEEFAHHLGMPHSKKIDDKLFELRTRGRQEVRILYTFYKGTIFLLHGFVKKTQKIKNKELAIAKQKLEALGKT